MIYYIFTAASVFSNAFKVKHVQSSTYGVSEFLLIRKIRSLAAVT